MKNIRNEEIKFVNCDMCGKDNTNDYLLFEDYKYVQCENCSLIYQNPRPFFSPLKKRYLKKYFYYEITNQKNFFELMKKTLQDIDFSGKFSKQFPAEKTFLDIGCATGLLLNYVREHGWNVKGIELDKYSADYAKKNFNLDIINKSLDEAKVKDNFFDVIHASHLIEHLPSPMAGLKKMHKMLKKGGYILLTTPRKDSFQQYLFKKNWRSYHRDHLFIFSKKTLCQMVEKANFKILKFISWGGIGKDQGYPFWMKNIADKTVKLINKGDVIFILARKVPGREL